jgi:hypothetical protein
MSDDVVVTPSDYRSSSKFNHDPLAEAIWVCSMDSGQNEEAGTTETIGWYALFHFGAAEDIEIHGGTAQYPVVEATVTVPRGSYILEQSDSGAVYVSRYPLKGAEVSEDWQKILDAESDAYGIDEEYWPGSGEDNYSEEAQQERERP